MIKLVTQLSIGFSFALSLLVSSFFTSPCLADEPAEAFLIALRDKGYFDVAIDYLTTLEKSDAISEEFRSSLPFEKAETLIISTEFLKRDIKMIESRLNEAQTLLSQFVKNDHSAETLARSLLYQGHLYFRRFIVYEIQSNNPRLVESEKQELIVQGRKMLEGALESYQESRKKIRLLIDPNSDSPDIIRIDTEDPDTMRRLKMFQTLYTKVRVKLPIVIERLADTYADGSPERTKLLNEAIKEYDDVFEDYQSQFMAGLEAGLYSSRCKQKLGKHKEALIGLESIFALSDSTAFRDLKKKAFLLASDSWNVVDPYPFVEITERLEPVVALLNRNEVRETDWLRVQMELAIARKALAADLKAKGGPNGSKDSRAKEREAARLMRDISRVPSPHRDQAKQYLSEWDIKVEDDDPLENPPETFVDARQQGKDNVADLTTINSEINKIRKRLTAAKSESEKTSIQSELDDALANRDEKTKKALALLDLAMEFADDKIAKADVNDVRYLQSFCYFATEQYFESALISKFLLLKYSSVEGTRQAMKLMIQSYAELLDAADKDDRDFELNRLTDACTTVVQRWPGTPEAGAAASTMTRLALNEKDFASAQKYMELIPSDSPNKASLASVLGQRMWFEYLAKKRETPNDPAIPQLLESTRTYLADAVRAASMDQLSYGDAFAALLLVNAHLDLGEIDQAVTQLESAPIAPLDLVAQKHPAVMQSEYSGIYISETYRNAIKAYLAKMKTGDAQQQIDKANGVLSAMRAQLESSPDPKKARSQITKIYHMIGSELSKQFQTIESVDKRKEFATSMASFLGGIERDANDGRTVLWSGATLLDVAGALNEQGETAAAKPMFTQAVSALDRAEKIGFQGEDNADALLIELERQRALAQRGAGNFDDAVQQFVKILKKKQSLSVQVDAAKTLQAWGKAKNLQRGYAEAMMGAEKAVNPKTNRNENLIWGWKKLVLATRTNEKYAETYYEALLNKIVCQFEYGKLAKSDKAISSSLKELRNAKDRHPEMGGDKWKPQFENLEAEISKVSK